MSFHEMEIKTEIETVEDWRPLDMQRAESSESDQVEGVPGGGSNQSNDDVGNKKSSGHPKHLF